MMETEPGIREGAGPEVIESCRCIGMERKYTLQFAVNSMSFLPSLLEALELQEFSC